MANLTIKSLIKAAIISKNNVLSILAIVILLQVLVVRQELLFIITVFLKKQKSSLNIKAQGMHGTNIKKKRFC